MIYYFQNQILFVTKLFSRYRYVFQYRPIHEHVKNILKNTNIKAPFNCRPLIFYLNYNFTCAKSIHYDSILLHNDSAKCGNQWTCDCQCRRLNCFARKAPLIISTYWSYLCKRASKFRPDLFNWSICSFLTKKQVKITSKTIVYVWIYFM